MGKILWTTFPFNTKMKKQWDDYKKSTFLVSLNKTTSALVDNTSLSLTDKPLIYKVFKSAQSQHLVTEKSIIEETTSK